MLEIFTIICNREWFEPHAIKDFTVPLNPNIAKNNSQYKGQAACLWLEVSYFYVSEPDETTVVLKSN